MKQLLIFMLSALLVASCLPGNVRVPQSPLLSTLERKSGLIAYIGVDGNIYISDQAGGNLAQLTEDALIPKSQGQALRYYQYPTWSRDGDHVAFVRLSSDGEQAQSDIVVADVNDNSLKEVYSSESEHPIYLNWSPEGRNISFISTNVSGQNIILQNVPAQGGDRTVLDAGSPYYWSWAPDGEAMIIHAGGAAASVPEHLAFLRTDADPVMEYALEATAGQFQAPAWSPDGSRIALARVEDGKNQIITTDAAGENPSVVGAFTKTAAFAWSPDSTRLAYIDGKQALEAGTVGSLHVVDMEGSEEIVEEGNIIAFFWSPSGEELAYFVLMQLQAEGSSSDEAGEPAQTGPRFALKLNVLDVTSGESRELFAYRPTQQFLNVLPYFDQYHQSVTIWSPDNNNLVLSFLNNQGTPGIAIVAASGNLEPRFLTEGYLAFWSWR